MFFDEPDSQTNDSPVVRAQIAQLFDNTTEFQAAKDAADIAAGDTLTMPMTDEDLEAPMTDEEYFALIDLGGVPYYPGHYQSFFADASDAGKMFATKFLKQRGLIRAEFGEDSPINVAGVFYVVTWLGEEKARLRIHLQSLKPEERAAYVAAMATPPGPDNILYFPQLNNDAA